MTLKITKLHPQAGKPEKLSYRINFATLISNENADNRVRKLPLAQTASGPIFDNQYRIKSVRP